MYKILFLLPLSRECGKWVRKVVVRILLNGGLSVIIMRDGYALSYYSLYDKLL